MAPPPPLPPPPPPPPIDPEDDARVCHRTAVLNGLRYHYMLSIPESGTWIGTIFLIHGWPDLSAGWRYQIPALTEIGFRVVVPDMCGYGGTDAPDGRHNHDSNTKDPNSTPTTTTNHDDDDQLYRYSFKSAADDLSKLAESLDAQNIILGGHDWGGLVVYRMAEYYPDLVSHIITVCTPYAAPSRGYRPPLEAVTVEPQLKYQIQLSDPDQIALAFPSKHAIRQFLIGIYGGYTVVDDDRGGGGGGERRGGGKREYLFDLKGGRFRFELLGRFREGTGLMGGKMLDYYAEQYARNGMHGPTNWYRTHKINYENDKSLLQSSGHDAAHHHPLAKIPILYIQPRQDAVFSDRMIERMKAILPHTKHVPIDGAAHWVLIQAPTELNTILVRWMHDQVIPDLQNKKKQARRRERNRM